MLAYILAIAVALGSFALYMAAFFFPEIHRKDDFLWSGVGLFYALVLWVCAGRITGGVLLGQMAGVALLGWFGWETLKLRRAIAHPEQREAIESFSLLEWLQEKLGSFGRKPQPQAAPAQTEATMAPETETAAAPTTAIEETLETLPEEKEEKVEEVPAAETVLETVIEMPAEKIEEFPAAETEITSETETVLEEGFEPPALETASKLRKSSFFSRLIGKFTSLFRKPKAEPTTQLEETAFPKTETDAQVIEPVEAETPEARSTLEGETTPSAEEPSESIVSEATLVEVESELEEGGEWIEPVELEVESAKIPAEETPLASPIEATPVEVESELEEEEEWVESVELEAGSPEIEETTLTVEGEAETFAPGESTESSEPETPEAAPTPVEETAVSAEIVEVVAVEKGSEVLPESPQSETDETDTKSQSNV